MGVGEEQGQDATHSLDGKVACSTSSLFCQEKGPLEGVPEVYSGMLAITHLLMI